MATSLFLCRKNGRFFKYDDVQAVSLTGAIETYSGVTGVSATNVVTISGATLSDGLQITFSQLSGGSNLTVNRTYFARDCSGATCKLAEYVGGTALSLGTDITDGNVTVQSDELKVWSSEYRDIFQTNATFGIPGSAGVTNYNCSTTLPGVGDPSVNGISVGLSFNGVEAQNNLTNLSDEAAHAPLRQTFLSRTHWKFDMGSSVAPRYLYAEWLTGDAVTPNPPNTI